ncbi:hypothetical protein Tco_0913300, partial [Tanacetum coccineum]
HARTLRKHSRKYVDQWIGTLAEDEHLINLRYQENTTSVKTMKAIPITQLKEYISGWLLSVCNFQSPYIITYMNNSEVHHVTTQAEWRACFEYFRAIDERIDLTIIPSPA